MPWTLEWIQLEWPFGGLGFGREGWTETTQLGKKI
jgi:hypothetical protein